MNIEKSVEKIHQLFQMDQGVMHFNCNRTNCEVLKIVAAEIEAAEREAYAKGFAEGCVPYKEGFRAAQERAVEISSTHECLVPIQECVCNGKIAERIKNMEVTDA